MFLPFCADTCVKPFERRIYWGSTTPAMSVSNHMRFVPPAGLGFGKQIKRMGGQAMHANTHACMCARIYQRWDSSAFMRISVEQKLKSLKSVVDDRFRGKKIFKNRLKNNPKQSKSLFGLSAFCRILKLFLDVRARCIVLAFKNGHAN